MSVLERGRAQPRSRRGLPAQVPHDPVQAGARASGRQRPDRIPGFGLDLDPDRAGHRVAQEEVDRRPVVGVLAGCRVAGLAVARLARQESIGGPRLEEVRVLGQHLVRELPDGRDVVEDPEAAPVRPDHQVVEVRLHLHPVHGRVRKIALERVPARFKSIPV